MCRVNAWNYGKKHPPAHAAMWAWNFFSIQKKGENLKRKRFENVETIKTTTMSRCDIVHCQNDDCHKEVEEFDITVRKES